MSSQRKLSSYSVFFIPWITPENKPSRAKVFHIKKVKSKSISYYAFSSPSSEERGESEILIAYLVLLSSTHLRPLPAHFKNKPVLRYFFKNKSTSQTKQEESEVHPRADESGLIQEFKKMPHLRGDRTTWSMWRQRADSSSTKLRITCKKKAHPVQDESCGKSTVMTNNHLLVLFVIFYYHFHFSFTLFSIFSCVLNCLFLFFAGTFGYFLPWSWLQNLRLGVIAWFSAN